MPDYYPLMLDVRDRPAIVVGGDAIAAEKAAALAASGARVTVLSPTFGDEVQALAAAGRVSLRHKAYQPGDLAGAFVVVAAVTHDPVLVEAIWTETQWQGQLVNIVDVPARCNFIVPSILRRGQLTIAVSTEGASPGLAKRIRQRLEGLFPPAYGAYLQLAAAARGHLRRAGVSYRRRDSFFGEFYESEALARLAEGDDAGAQRITVALLRHYGVEVADAALQEVR